jgi:hypothetical protein
MTMSIAEAGLMTFAAGMCAGVALCTVIMARLPWHGKKERGRRNAATASQG